MSDPIDLTRLGAMVSRLQSTTEDVRGEHAGIRAGMDAVHARLNESGLRLNSLEFAQIKLAGRMDTLDGKLDRIIAKLGA